MYGCVTRRVGWSVGRTSFEWGGGGGGGGLGPKVCVPKWPDHILPDANFVMSHDGHFGLGGGGDFGEGPPPPLGVLIILKTRVGGGGALQEMGGCIRCSSSSFPHDDTPPAPAPSERTTASSTS